MAPWAYDRVRRAPTQNPLHSVSHRTDATPTPNNDLFSLGLVLYEMAAGRRAFAGSTNAVISAAILQHAPIAPRQIRGELPERIEDIILKALEKDRAVPCHTAAELLADMTRLKRDLDSDRGAHIRRDSVHIPADQVQSDSAAARSSPVSPSSDAQIVAGLLKRHWRALTFGSVIVAIAVYRVVRSLATWRATSSGVIRIPRGPASRAADDKRQRIGASHLTELRVRDVFAVWEGKDASVWIRQTATSSNVQIVPPGPFLGGIYCPAVTVTPDGGFVDVVRVEDDGKFSSALWRVPFLGGTPRRLLDDIASPVGWSPDGRSFAFVRGRGSALVLADADGSHERVLAGSGERAWAFLTFLGIPSNPLVRPAWSPDGRLIAMHGYRLGGGVLQPLVFFTSVADGSVQAVPVSLGITGLAWLDASSLVLSLARASRSRQPLEGRCGWPPRRPNCARQRSFFTSRHARRSVRDLREDRPDFLDGPHRGRDADAEHEWADAIPRRVAGWQIPGLPPHRRESACDHRVRPARLQDAQASATDADDFPT